MTPLPTIGITMGDPSGVGPEIICKALAEMPAQEKNRVSHRGQALTALAARMRTAGW